MRYLALSTIAEVETCEYLTYGAGACPPEDVGGMSGFAEFLRTMGDRRHPERASMLEWVGGAFDPHAFDPAAVRFDDPGERWKAAFEQPSDQQRGTRCAAA